VLVDREVQSLAERCDRRLERLVGELRDIAAAAADDVVVMRIGAHGLVTRRSVTDLQPVHEPDPVEHLQRAIDARDPDPLVGSAQVVRELLRGDAAGTCGKGVDHPLAGGAAPEPASLERLRRVLPPGFSLRPHLGVS
jgi:hypothetical protein